MNQPLDYTLITLPCWTKGCTQTFDVFTDLSNHHLAAHERTLERYAVTDFVARTLGPEAVAPAATAQPLQECPVDLKALCTCGCVYDSHSYFPGEPPGHACLVCDCPGFMPAAVTLAQDVTPPDMTGEGEPEAESVPMACSALQLFEWECHVSGTPHRELEARLLLERLGVPPEAPADDWIAAIKEAVNRWRDRQEGAAPTLQPRRMWQVGIEGDHFHVHDENEYCGTAGCVSVVEEAR